MTRVSRSLAVFSALAVAGASALAVARDEASSAGDRFAAFFGTGEICPPTACSIVYKTSDDGPPSRIVAVD